MEFKYFKLIKTIAEEGSISSSAGRLFLTQSALSHQLRDIEERLGFKIFYRSRNKWQLTREGKELYELSNKVLGEIDEGLQKIKNIKAGEKGKISISTECYSFYQGLPEFIQKSAVLYPEIEIELDIGATHQPIDKILNNELDLAIVTQFNNSDQLHFTDIFEDEIMMLLHRENQLAKNEYITANDFRDLHLIIHSYPLETVSVYELFLKKEKVHPSKTSAIPLTEVALEMVKTNMGVMCLPMWALKSFTVPKELIFKRISYNGLHRQHRVVTRRENLRKSYIKDFLSNITEEFAQ
ncbi:MAG: LysR family transcriptional regulator [Bacteroidota bacterium]